jgi:ribose-phosphate pyrophosphokinase
LKKPVDHLVLLSFTLCKKKSLGLDNLTLFSRYKVQKSHAYSKFLESDVVIFHKQRKAANVIGTMELIGEVKGKM